MILPNFKDFPKNGRFVGIDWGARRTGIAISDESCAFVFTREKIELENPIDKIMQIIKQERIEAIIIGLPVRSDGSESDTCKSVRLFAENLSKFTDLPIAFIAENLTSVEAVENLLGVKRGNKIKQNLDSESAKIILENAIAMICRI